MTLPARREFQALKWRRRSGILAFLVILIASLWAVHFDLERFWRGLPAMGDLVRRILNPDFGESERALKALAETFELAIAGTALGLVLALPAVLLSANNIAPWKAGGKVLNGLFAFLRTIPSLVWAALLVAIFSIGRFAGLVALAIIAFLMAQKLLREAVEALPENLLDSLRSVGAKRSQVLLKAVLPKLQDELWSSFFLILESNIRSASVLGFVGAGGIGQILWTDLNHLRYDRVATVILLLFLSIFALDLLSFLVRKRLARQASYSDFASYKRHQRLKTLTTLVLLPALLLAFIASLNLSFERVLIGGSHAMRILSRLAQPEWSYWPSMLRGLNETFFIAVSATLLGALPALLLSYLAAVKIGPSRWLAWPCKALMNLLRAFPPMITAIIFFRGVGPGPMAGTLALTLYTTGVLGKLYHELLENLPPNLSDSLIAVGASRWQVFRRGLIPQTFDRFLALCLYRLESNLRNSTLLGIVGAGGIGQLMSMNIQVRAWERVSLLILALALLVFVLDRFSAAGQKRLR